MINIIVCIKQVSDPEAPSSSYQVDNEAKHIIQKGIPPVISTFDENALEAALRIKDTYGAKITALSMGRNLSKAVLSKSLAAGADELILLEDNVFDNIDSSIAATILASAIKKIGNFDVIFTGIQSADWNAGITGPGIAEVLGIPDIIDVRGVELDGNILKVERVFQNGYQVLQVPFPALLTIRSDIGELRTIALRQMIEAQNKPVIKWNTDDLGINLHEMKYAKLLRLFIPQKESICEMVQGTTDEESGIKLAFILRENGLI